MRGEGAGGDVGGDGLADEGERDLLVDVALDEVIDE